MPQPGHFKLHSRVVPPLVAGDYVLEADQSIPEESDASFEPYRGHLRVTSPRFRLPPDHILSTFPPANAEGAFESRLPQVVLRRRTLPWERAVDPSDRSIPWLALVVIAEGEGELSAEKPVTECVTAGVTLTGPNDVATGVHLTVPQSVVQKVFPTKQDLPLLAHVREVDLEDTELAMGDDDGFLAVVLANRLPQFDRVGCKPVRYLACLINLEGQLDVLPPPTPPVTVFDVDAFVFDAAIAAMQAELDPDLSVMGTGLPFTGSGLAQRRSATRAQVSGTAAGGASAVRAGLQSSVPAAAEQPHTVNEWRLHAQNVETVAVTAPSGEAGRLVRDAMKAGFRFPIELVTIERVFRFPVLAHWSFTCTGAGSFETLMRGLDVGLLGTTMGPAPRANRPDCAQPPGGDAPPDAPASRPAPELAETGHVGLPHLTRRGEPLRSWYRGPLTPHVMTRDPATGGHLPVAHTSDQLRRVVPDGREDLSLAAAFEIGRLLALSHPAVIAALMRWRREQFGAERARRLALLAAGSAGLFDAVLGGTNVRDDLGRLLGRELVLASAQDPARILAPSRPLVDPGRPIEFLAARDIDEVIATGFGIPLATVRTLRSTMDAAVLELTDVPVVDAGDSFDFDGLALQTALTERVESLAADAIGRRAPGIAVRGGARRDALDTLLDDAAQRRRKEIEG
ncbi:MAG: hypothetical protein ACREF4_02425 [Gammaproteobacteria bacterium]